MKRRNPFSMCLAILLGLMTAVPAMAVPAVPEEPENPPPTIHGDAGRLTVLKSWYYEGEPILVSGIGQGTDWIGIYTEEGYQSVRWTYVDAGKGGPGSGVEVNLREVPNTNAAEPVHLPSATYIIRLMPDDTTDTSRAIAWTTVKVVKAAPVEPLKPVSASYRLVHETDGFSEGTVTVTVEESNRTGTDIVLFWADDNGKLPGYEPLAKFKVTGTETTRTLPPHVLIPHGATRLLVYTHSAVKGTLSEEAVSVELPAQAAAEDFGKPLHTLSIISDLQIPMAAGHLHRRHFEMVLADLAELIPDSMGTFIVGDMADTGDRAEYEFIRQAHARTEGAAPMFLCIGNHDLTNGSYEQQTRLFLEYATLPDGTHPTSPHYDFWLNGYHFIFVGSDETAGDRTVVGKETAEWLDKTLSERYDPERPTFVFLHQPMLDTVAGSLPGQGWNGVVDEQYLRAVLAKYPEVMMFNGHTHWILDSESNMHPRDDKLPAIFNTAATAYLWDSYDVITGEYYEGCQGYVVEIYRDRILIRGRNFLNGNWFPSSQYCLLYAHAAEGNDPSGSDTEGTETLPSLPTDTETPTPTDPAVTDPAVTDPASPSPETPTVPDTESASSPDSSASSGDDISGCRSLVGSAGVALATVTAGGVLLRKKKQRDIP